MNSLIIGFGEVGKALYNVLKPYYNCGWRDKDIFGGEQIVFTNTDIMHICFPFTEKDFVADTMLYMTEYEPKYTVIHSTVPVGTSKTLKATHSPIRGKHPFLEDGIRRMVKFVGGANADEVAKYFMKADIRCIVVRNSDTTELGKILSTNYYAACIEFVKEAERICQRNEVPFHEAFTLFQQTYNEGWLRLGHAEFMRPVLQPLQGKLDGHCLYPNLKLLPSSDYASFLAALSEDPDNWQKVMLYGGDWKNATDVQE